jgi:hypothetical protein
MAHRQGRIYQLTLRSILFLIFVLCCIFAWLHNRHERWRRESLNLESEWELVESDPVVAPHCVSFKEGDYTCVYTADGTTISGKYAIHPLSRQKQIDLIDVNQGGVRLRGVYRIDSDRMVIVRSAPGARRPVSTDGQSDSVKMTYRRIPLSEH